MKKHSELGASSAERWMNCPGSVALIREIGVKNTSAYADEGTAAHELAERCLQDPPSGKERAGDWIGEIIKVEREIEDGGKKRSVSSEWEVTDEMADAVQVYLDYIDRRCSENPTMWGRLVEQKIELTHLDRDMFGTADCVLCGVDGGEVLEVVDYKHGAGVIVDANDNPQLAYYAYGAYYSLRKVPERSRIKKIKLTIVQPRAKAGDPIKSFTFDVVDLIQFAEELEVAAGRTRDPNAPLNPGEWCKWCPAKGGCPALRDMATKDAGLVFQPSGEVTIIPPTQITPADVAKFLEAREVIKLWMDAVWEHAMQLAEKGEPPPGWKLVEKRGTRRWNKVAELEDWVINTLQMPKEVLYETDLRSPAKLEKMLPKDQRKKLDEFTIVMSSGNTLARESSNKPAVTGSRAQDVFTAID